MGAFTNLRLVAVVMASVAVQLAIHHMPVTQRLFQVSNLSIGDCLLSLLLGLVPVTIIEVSKLLRRASNVPRAGAIGGRLKT